MRLFVYGELCKAPVLMGTLGRIPPACVAVLHGYRKDRDDASGYYHAIPKRGAAIVGLLLDELDEDDLARLDRFEDVGDGRYQRIEVEVEIDRFSGGAKERAFVYVRPGAR